MRPNRSRRHCCWTKSGSSCLWRCERYCWREERRVRCAGGERGLTFSSGQGWVPFARDFDRLPIGWIAGSCSSSSVRECVSPPRRRCLWKDRWEASRRQSVPTASDCPDAWWFVSEWYRWCSLPGGHSGPSVRWAERRELVPERLSGRSSLPIDIFDFLLDLGERRVVDVLHVQEEVQTLDGEVRFAEFLELAHTGRIREKFAATEWPTTDAKLRRIVHPRSSREYFSPRSFHTYRGWMRSQRSVSELSHGLEGRQEPRKGS